MKIKDLSSFETQLDTLAGEINADNYNLDVAKESLIKMAARLGQKISKAKDLCGKHFNFWLTYK